MDNPLSFYELFEGLQGFNDIEKLGEVFKKESDVAEEKIAVADLKSGLFQWYTVLLLYCNYEKITPKKVILMLNEIDRKSWADKFKAHCEETDSSSWSKTCAFLTVICMFKYEEFHPGQLFTLEKGLSWVYLNCTCFAS